MPSPPPKHSAREKRQRAWWMCVFKFYFFPLLASPLFYCDLAYSKQHVCASTLISLLLILFISSPRHSSAYKSAHYGPAFQKCSLLSLPTRVGLLKLNVTDSFLGVSGNFARINPSPAQDLIYVNAEEIRTRDLMILKRLRRALRFVCSTRNDSVKPLDSRNNFAHVNSLFIPSEFWLIAVETQK